MDIISLRESPLQKRSRLIIFAAIFACIGAVFILITQAASTTQTFSGKLTTRQTSQTFNTNTEAGQLDATLTLKDSTPMTLTLLDAAGTTVVTKTGSSPLTVSAPSSKEAYKWVVSSSAIPKKGLTFTLKITNTTSTTNDTTPPTTPTNLTATPKSSSSIDLSWSASTDNIEVVGYDIYRGGVKVGSTAAITYSDSGLTASTAYSYQVKAKDAAGNLSQQATVNATTLAPVGDTQPPSAPTNLKAIVISNYQIDLSWTPSTDNVGVAAYEVYYHGSLIKTVTDTAYSHTNLTPNTTYTYYVKAKDAAGNVSTASNSVQATTQSVTGDTEKPTVPSNFTAIANGPNQVSISWGASTDNVGVVGYKVYRHSTGTLSPNITLGPTATSYIDNDVTPHSQYQYSVIAIDAAGNSASTASKRIFIPGSADIKVSAPTSGTIVSGIITVSGTASSLNGQVAKVEVAGSYGNYQLASGTTNWTATLDTSRIPDSTTPAVDDPTHPTPVSRYIFAKVTDSNGDFEVVTVPLTIKNDTIPPSATLTSPANNASQPGFYTISGTASDNVGVKKVYIRGGSSGSVEAVGTTNWTAVLTTKADYPPSQIVVFDVNGNKSVTEFNIWAGTQTYSGSISGKAYFDANNSRSFDSGDQVLSNHIVWLHTSKGQYLSNMRTDASGNYNFSGLQNGDYKVRFYRYNDIEFLNQLWIPFDNRISRSTSTHEQLVTMSGSATADFGFRQINRIPDPNKPGYYLPMATLIGSNGLTTKQYDDVITAQEIYDRTTAGKLIGEEARATTVIEGDNTPVLFGAGLTQGSNTIRIPAGSTIGRCEVASSRATSHIYWPHWYSQEDESTLFHEYGHAFDNYWGCVHQDLHGIEYMRVRGMDLNDPRIGTNHMWSPPEMFTEDYSQLFSAKPIIEQENTNIPRAAEVPGLKEFITTTYKVAR